MVHLEYDYVFFVIEIVATIVPMASLSQVSVLLSCISNRVQHVMFAPGVVFCIAAIDKAFILVVMLLAL